MTNKIESKKSNKSKEQNFNNKLFYSLKNNCEFEYDNDAIRRFMLAFEMDGSIDRYKLFEFGLVSVNDINVWDVYPGLIYESEGQRNFVIISNRLAGNRGLTNQVRQLLQQCEPKPIQLNVGREDSMNDDLLTNNLGYLYEFALLPHDHKAFAVLKDSLEFLGDTTIGQLKRCVNNEAAIYQLMFHHAIRTDLESSELCDDTIVFASPIINSIIRNL